MISVVFQGIGKADIGRRVDQDLVSAGTHHVQCADNSSQDTVLIADALRCQPLCSVAGLLPADDTVEILFPGLEVAESGMVQPPGHGTSDRRRCGKVHIRDPHGNDVKSLRRRLGREPSGISNRIHRQCVVTVTVHNRGKIIFHIYLYPLEFDIKI